MGRVKARFKKLNDFGVWWKSNPVLNEYINSWHCHDNNISRCALVRYPGANF
ncbi:hypothetical protein [Dysgonomonas macrotermitis]|uniref:Uncharacterized protein n=1 Tax=Dysgonomonas macrotermitis TaxID=1346286 RepID=A0A1M5IZL7_9BACT|nr:hypothetical protein [Dysgonomonas macrotermitis]SHG33721.1 hypothetical protein SAMN05444362_12168 [Dysgonomonas macrotermitis]